MGKRLGDLGTHDKSRYMDKAELYNGTRSGLTESGYIQYIIYVNLISTSSDV